MILNVFSQRPNAMFSRKQENASHWNYKDFTGLLWLIQDILWVNLIKYSMITTLNNTSLLQFNMP